MVYIVNPFRSRSVLPWLCAAFFKMYDSCMKSLQPNPVSGLVLQIVPLDLIASPQVITLPSAKTYTRLALEVYDRCRPNSVERNRQGSQFRCAPVTRLARAVPKTINFRLTSDPSTELLHSDRCFHLSYTWSYNQDWLTASWTDNQGALQWNAAYCLGEEELEPWRTFLAIAREMWETTMEILKPGNSSWRFFIAKDSRMNKEELRGKPPFCSPVVVNLTVIIVWLSLCSDTRHPFVSITLITVDPDPPLRFPRSYTLDRNPTIANNPCPTPVSTPLTSTFSPDQTGFVSTPGGTTAQTSAPTPTTGVFDHNAEARLIDITDETWGATIARGLDDPNVPTDCCHASMSGYLIKRAGARDEDGLMAFAVNIIHAQKPDKALLKDVLGMYRGLTMLAKVRGVVDPESNVLPWHVAAAKKAHAVVNSTMRWAGE